MPPPPTKKTSRDQPAIIFSNPVAGRNDIGMIILPPPAEYRDSVSLSPAIRVTNHIQSQTSTSSSSTLTSSSSSSSSSSTTSASASTSTTMTHFQQQVISQNRTLVKLLEQDRPLMSRHPSFSAAKVQKVDMVSPATTDISYLNLILGSHFAILWISEAQREVKN